MSVSGFILLRYILNLKVSKAQHVLAVADFDAAVAYFTQMLGFTAYNRVHGWSLLHLGDLWIADKPWGLREFLVETPEGHRIKFGQALHSAGKRGT